MTPGPRGGHYAWWHTHSHGTQTPSKGWCLDAPSSGQVLRDPAGGIRPSRGAHCPCRTCSCWRRGRRAGVLEPDDVVPFSTETNTDGFWENYLAGAPGYANAMCIKDESPGDSPYEVPEVRRLLAVILYDGSSRRRPTRCTSTHRMAASSSTKASHTYSSASPSSNLCSPARPRWSRPTVWLTPVRPTRPCPRRCRHGRRRRCVLPHPSSSGRPPLTATAYRLRWAQH